MLKGFSKFKSQFVLVLAVVMCVLCTGPSEARANFLGPLFRPGQDAQLLFVGNGARNYYVVNDVSGVTSYSFNVSGVAWSFQFPGKSVFDAKYGVGNWSLKLFGVLGQTGSDVSFDIKFRDALTSSDVVEVTNILNSSTSVSVDNFVVDIPITNFSEDFQHVELAIKMGGGVGTNIRFGNGFGIYVVQN